MVFEPAPRVAPKSLTDGAAVTAPRIVNGLTVRPRKPIDVWYFGLLLLPDFAALLVLAVLGMHRMLRYFDAKRRKQG